MSLLNCISFFFGKLKRKSIFKTFFVDYNGTRLIDGRIWDNTQDTGHPGDVNIQISETNLLSVIKL